MFPIRETLILSTDISGAVQFCHTPQKPVRGMCVFYIYSFRFLSFAPLSGEAKRRIASWGMYLSGFDSLFLH